MGKFTEALRSEIGSYEATEWSGKLGDHDVVLNAKPLTPADITKISRKHPNFIHSPNLEGMVDLFILKCRDTNDERAFDGGDKPLLMRVGQTKIGEIFGALFSDQLVEYSEDDLDDDVKN